MSALADFNETNFVRQTSAKEVANLYCYGKLTSMEEI